MTRLPHEPAWALSPDDALRMLGSAREGLSGAEAERRLAEHGPNALPSARRLGWLRILGRQFASPILATLSVAGVITLAIKDWTDAAVILLAVLANALLGLYQEAKAENTLALLSSYVKEQARVMRDGAPRTVEASELVPGDIVRLAAGDRVPADGRVLATTDLETDESILTGESLPAAKRVEAVMPEAPLGDRVSMAWSGTTVVQGSGLLVVSATGSATELGRIASLVAGARQEETPLQKAFLSFTYRASLLLGALSLGLFAYGVAVGKEPLEMFLISVATAVAAVPEGLPVALTVILAIGVQRLAARRGVVRKLLAAETLGSTTVVLTDKTGTLTEARMELEAVIPLAETLTQERLLEFAVSHVDVAIENPEAEPADWRLSGRPVEVALVRGSTRFGVRGPRVRELYQELDRLPFNSTNKFSASVVRGPEGVSLVLMGAPEALLRHARLPDAERKEILQTVDKLAYEGARVLAVAAQELVEETRSAEEHVRAGGTRLLGLLAFRDPVRPSVRAALARITAAGVRTIVISGDHAGTAGMVAREVGLADEPVVITGADIDAADDAALVRLLRGVHVIARTTPEHKLRVARSLKASGEVVAMTGDGVNDAPALREADIGISLGTGSDVAKAAADLVLLDDDFATIVAAVEEGRNILQNVRKVIAYLLGNALDGLLLIGGSLATGVALPLSTLQILWVNLFTGSFPAMALAFERDHGDLGRGPVRIGKTIFDPELRFLVLGVGTFTSVALFGAYYGLLRAGFDPALVRTFVFASFGLYTLFVVFALRSLRRSVLSFSPLGNRYLLAGTGIGFALMGLAIYAPPLQALFGTVPLPAAWLGGVLLFGIGSVAAVEAAKKVFGKRAAVHA